MLFVQDQLEQHISPDVHLNVYVYYGPDRSKDPALLSRQDIVLTTYNILASDYGVSEIPKIIGKMWWVRLFKSDSLVSSTLFVLSPNGHCSYCSLNEEGILRKKYHVTMQLKMI